MGGSVRAGKLAAAPCLGPVLATTPCTSQSPAHCSLCHAVVSAGCGVQQLLAEGKSEGVNHVCLFGEAICTNSRLAAVSRPLTAE